MSGLTFDLGMASGSGVVLLTALVAALISGAIGYGFSTLLVPVALLYYTSRVLNPGLVLAEIALNLLGLWLNRGALPRVFRRVLPMIVASIPGIVLGVWVLKVARADWLRFGTYVVLLPLVLLQAAGLRRPMQPGSRAELPLGLGIGVLYSTTTISGPPLALLFSNQGLAQDEFRASLALFRVVESVATAIVYLTLGLYSPGSQQVALLILPCIVLGVPIGRLLIGKIDAELFRRLCMALDAWLISFGLSRLLLGERPAIARLAYAPLVIVVILDAVILYRFLAARRLSAVNPSSGSQVP